jgi:nitronate monooxygenase/enoyl-[acyl-carrier protein] reductase II
VQRGGFRRPRLQGTRRASVAEDTVYASLFDLGWDAPHRVLRNRAVKEWEASGRPRAGARTGEGVVFATAPRGGTSVELRKYWANSYPTLGFEGDIETAVLYAGESCALVDGIKPAAQIVSDIAHEARVIIAGLQGLG